MKKLLALLIIASSQVIQSDTQTHEISSDPKFPVQKITVNIFNRNSQTHLQLPPKPSEPEMPVEDESVFSLPSLGKLSLRNFLGHKYLFAAGTLLTGYAAIWAHLLWTARQLTHKKMWATWKDELPLEVLLSLAPENCARELLNDAADKYRLLDLSAVSSKLQTELEWEIKQLHYFAQLHAWINWFGLTRLFSKQEEALLLAEGGIQRLIFLKRSLAEFLNMQLHQVQEPVARRKRYL